MPCLTRGLAGEEMPCRERRCKVWNLVAFTNYVPETVGEGPRVRPTRKMWIAAERAFPKLLERLQPQRVLVLGKGMWDRMPKKDMDSTDDGRWFINGEVEIKWVYHPCSGRMSWKRLADVIRDFCPGAF